jgi:hypothetical protein
MERPYFSMVEEFEDQISTIMLVKTNYSKDFMIKLVNDVDYLDSLNTEIQPLLLPSDENATAVYEKYVSDKERQRAASQQNVNESIIKSDASKSSDYQIFDNFSIAQVRESTDEIVNIHQHFGGSFSVLVFGTAPMIYSFSGVFVDGQNMPHYQKFQEFYDNYLKASKISGSNTSCLLSCNGKVVDGFILNLQATGEANQTKIKGFTFNFIVKKYYWIRGIGGLSLSQATSQGR